MEHTVQPMIVGITGHRDLPPEQLAQIRREVRRQLRPLHPQLLLSAAAAGADQLCAQEALQLGIRLRCPLPMPEADYSEDFSPEELAEFYQLLDRAEEAFSVTSAPVTDRDLCYRRVGEYIADHCRVLLALWDGDTRLQNGVGTAAIVHYALTKGTCAVLQIQVGRCSTGSRPDVISRWLTPRPDEEEASR